MASELLNTHSSDLDQTMANSAFVAIDKGLLSGKVHEQVESIVKFPALFDTHPFPLLINSSMLKLADVFRVGSNFTRLCILRVCQRSRRHLDKIVNVDEVVRRIFSVNYCNDPVARAITLSTLSNMASLVAGRSEVQHAVRRALHSHDAIEQRAGVSAARRLAAVCATFAASISTTVGDMVEAVTTPAPVKLHLFSVLTHMHHDSRTAATVRDVCVRVLPSLPSEQFVVTNLRVLTQLAAHTLVNIPQQVDLLLEYLNTDVRQRVKYACLDNLLMLASRSAILWTQENYSALVCCARDMSRERALIAARTVTVLACLTGCAAPSQLDLTSGGRLVKLCSQLAYHSCRPLACAAVKLLTTAAITSGDAEVQCVSACACDSLLLLLVTLPVASQPTNGHDHTLIDSHLNSPSSAAGCQDRDSLRHLSSLLRCVVQLLTHWPAEGAGSQLVESVASLARGVIGATTPSSAATAGPLLAALCATGHRWRHLVPPAVVADLLTAVLECRDSAATVSPTDDKILVQLCTLLLQQQTWLQHCNTSLLMSAVGSLDAWQCYRVARQAMRYGDHGTAGRILSSLRDSVCSEYMSHWLAVLSHMTAGEHALSSLSLTTLPSRAALLDVLSRSTKHHSRALSSITALTGCSQQQQQQQINPCRHSSRDQLHSANHNHPHNHHNHNHYDAVRQRLSFIGRFCRLRWRWLLSLARLAASSGTLQTCPPPCVAVAPASGGAPATAAAAAGTSTVDAEEFGVRALRSGRIVPQLRVCSAELLQLSVDYTSLYDSLFDADTDTLACVSLLQQCCHLLADVVNWAVAGHCSSDLASLSASIDRVTSAVSAITGDNAQLSEAAQTTFSSHTPRSNCLTDVCSRVGVVLKSAHDLVLSDRLPPSSSSSSNGVGGVVVEGVGVAVTHHHTAAIMTAITLLCSAPLCVPRYFFQTLQNTVVSLAVQPQPRSMSGESVLLHPASSQLTVKVDGVISHGDRSAIYRAVSRVRLSVHTNLQKKACSVSADKGNDSGNVSIDRLLTPHNDYFHGQFLLDLRTLGVHVISVEAFIVDVQGRQWRTCCEQQQLLVRVFDEHSRAPASSSTTVN